MIYTLTVKTRIMLQISFFLSCCLFFLLLLHISEQKTNYDRPPKVITFSPKVLRFLGREDEEDEIEATTRFDIQKPLGPPPMLYQCEDNWSMDTLRPKYVPDMRANVWVDDEHEIIYCGSKGDLSQRILYLLANLNNDIPVPYKKVNMEKYQMSKFKLKPMSYFTDDGVDARLDAYTTILGVQHPLDRLRSSFEKDRKGLTSKDSMFSRLLHKESADEKFSKFVDYLVDKSLDSKSQFEPLYVTCRPCLVTYDVIVRWENLKEDLDSLIRFKKSKYGDDMSKAENIIEEDLFSPTRSEPDIRISDSVEFYEKLPKVLLDKLHNIYHLDFILFDYKKLHDNL